MTAYTLLNNERIVVGPRDWNPAYFQHFLFQDFNIDFQLSESPIIEPIIFNDNLKLVPTSFAENPQIDPNFEVIAGPRFSYDENGNHIASYYAKELPLDDIKSNLLSSVSNNRYVKETTPITRDINGKSLTLYTNRELRSSYSQTLILAPDEYSSQWKFPEGFISIDKSDLQQIVLEINNHIQSCFDWEASKTIEINSVTTSEELRNIILE